jgi:hypothetical protein
MSLIELLSFGSIFLRLTDALTCLFGFEKLVNNHQLSLYERSLSSSLSSRIHKVLAHLVRDEPHGKPKLGDSFLWHLMLSLAKSLIGH